MEPLWNLDIHLSRGALRKAQAAAAAHPEFAGNVAFVETHVLVRKEEDSPGGWPRHEFNNAETYYLVGDALGKAMAKLLGFEGVPVTCAGLLRISPRVQSDRR